MQHWLPNKLPLMAKKTKAKQKANNNNQLFTVNTTVKQNNLKPIYISQCEWIQYFCLFLCLWLKHSPDIKKTFTEKLVIVAFYYPANIWMPDDHWNDVPPACLVIVEKFQSSKIKAERTCSTVSDSQQLSKSYQSSKFLLWGLHMQPQTTVDVHKRMICSVSHIFTN